MVCIGSAPSMVCIHVILLTACPVHRMYYGIFIAWVMVSYFNHVQVRSYHASQNSFSLNHAVTVLPPNHIIIEPLHAYIEQLHCDNGFC